MIGAGLTWGHFVADVPPATLRGRSVNFQFNIVALQTNVNFWDSNTGTFLGTFVGGGVSGGIGTGGGHGSF